MWLDLKDIAMSEHLILTMDDPVVCRDIIVALKNALNDTLTALPTATTNDQLDAILHVAAYTLVERHCNMQGLENHIEGLQQFALDMAIERLKGLVHNWSRNRHKQE
jgi:hypothetical protein